MASSGHGSQHDASDMQAVEVINPTGRGSVVLACEHAACTIPHDLGTLGLAADLLNSHIAWDPGALAVAELLSRQLDAPLVAARISRLVYDCNRPPDAEDAIAAFSEVHPIPGNADLTHAQRSQRAERVYRPFAEALAACLDRRRGKGRSPTLLTVHSFTPVYRGVPRTLDLGVVHDTDARLADALLAVAASDDDFDARRNAPYGPADGVTHTLATHALPRRLLNAMLEIRSDLIAAPDGQEAMAARLTRYIRLALGRFRTA